MALCVYVCVCFPGKFINSSSPLFWFEICPVPPCPASSWQGKGVQRDWVFASARAGLPAPHPQVELELWVSFAYDSLTV